MIRVTVELVPFGVEAMVRTISEVCIANIGTDPSDTANYIASGYLIGTDKKIEEFAVTVSGYDRNSGVLELLREVLSQGHQDLSAVDGSESLLLRTRLAAEALSTDEKESSQEVSP